MGKAYSKKLCGCLITIFRNMDNLIFVSFFKIIPSKSFLTVTKAVSYKGT